MACGIEKGGPLLLQKTIGLDDGGVSRRRGRPSRRIQVAVEYRSQTKEEVTSTTTAVRLLLREMVRRRMGFTEEENHD